MTTTGGKRGLWSFGRDISVIILAVLIALAVDGLVAERADRTLERQYLSRLARDLRADSLALVRFREQAVSGEYAAQELLEVLEHRSLAADTVVAAYFGDATRDAYLEPNSPTIQELQSTGNLRVIEEATMRDAILSYYAEVTRLQRMLETVMGRGKNPLGEVGWDVRAFDPAIGYAVVPAKDPTFATDEISSPRVQGGQLVDRFRNHPDAERATLRAITYNKMLQSVLDLWQESVDSTMVRVADRPNER